MEDTFLKYNRYSSGPAFDFLRNDENVRIKCVKSIIKLLVKKWQIFQLILLHYGSTVFVAPDELHVRFDHLLMKEHHLIVSSIFDPILNFFKI